MLSTVVSKSWSFFQGKQIVQHKEFKVAERPGKGALHQNTLPSVRCLCLVLHLSAILTKFPLLSQLLFSRGAETRKGQ